MKEYQSQFISMVIGYIMMYAKQYGYYAQAIPAILAQAICESNWGRSSLSAKYNNFFGMKCGSSWKGKSVNMSTKEEYEPGTLTNIKANFRAYDTVEDGIKGYFDFISTSRYANLKTATTYTEYLNRIKADGYATSSTYVSTLTGIIRTYNLAKYATFYIDTDTSTTAYYPPCTGYDKGSIIDALKFIGEDSSKTNRTKIAEANGIKNYTGTAAQNKMLLSLLKAGMLVKP